MGKDRVDTENKQMEIDSKRYSILIMEIKSTIRLTNNLYQAEVMLGDNGLTPVESEVILILDNLL